MMNWEALISALSLLATLTVLATFAISRRNAAVEEGKRQQQLSDLKEDLERAFSKIREIEAREALAKESASEMRGDLKHVRSTVDELKELLLGHLLEGKKG